MKHKKEMNRERRMEKRSGGEVGKRKPKTDPAAKRHKVFDEMKLLLKENFIFQKDKITKISTAGMKQKKMGAN